MRNPRNQETFVVSVGRRNLELIQESIHLVMSSGDTEEVNHYFCRHNKIDDLIWLGLEQLALQANEESCPDQVKDLALITGKLLRMSATQSMKIKRLFNDPRLSAKILHSRDGTGRDRENVLSALLEGIQEEAPGFIQKISQALRSGTAITDYWKSVTEQLLPVPITQPATFPDFASEFCQLCLVGDLDGATKFRRDAQKSENSERRDNAKLLAVNMTDLLRYSPYALGMKAILGKLQKENRCDGLWDGLLYWFFHTPQECLQGIIPAAHPLGEILAKWDEFLVSAVEYYRSAMASISWTDQQTGITTVHSTDAHVSIEAAAGFFGRLQSAITCYRFHTENVRDEDARRKREKYSPVTFVESINAGDDDPESDFD